MKMSVDGPNLSAIGQGRLLSVLKNASVLFVYPLGTSPFSFQAETSCPIDRHHPPTTEATEISNSADTSYQPLRWYLSGSEPTLTSSR